MTHEEIEEFIRELDKEVTEKELCVFPDKETFDCCDCYLCHVDYYNQIRRNLSIPCQH